MKILIAYASAGAGHKSSSEAIFDSLKEETGHKVSLVDCLDYTSPLFKFVYSHGYAFLIRYFPFLWSLVFKTTDNQVFLGITGRLRGLADKLVSKRFIQYLITEQFDCCICTQFLPNEIVSQLKTDKKIRARLICVVTDYNVHRFWLAGEVDIYAVACREAKQKLLRMGVAEKKIQVTGVPVNPRFLSQLDKQQLINEMGLKPGLLTVLMLTGAIGIGPLKEIVEELQDRFQLLVVCGKNKSLCARLNRIKNEYTKVYGLVNNVEELMSVADLVITKPGGLTISEALVKHLPMLFISEIPGQETGNAKLMIDYNIGLSVQDVKNIKNKLGEFTLNHHSLAYMKANTWRLSKPYATRKILQLIHG